MFEAEFKAQEMRPEHNQKQIENVVYDYYADRKATYSSSDQYVKVWNKTTEGKWTLTSSLKKTDSGAIWNKVTWAHPKYGQILATCSALDGTVGVWEEIGRDTPLGSDKSDTIRNWVHRENINSKNSIITDVKFGPKSQGLQLATCSTEGFIRIYEAPVINKLSQWTLKHEIQCQLSLSCLDWSFSLSKLDTPLIAAGSNATDDEAIDKVLIYEYNEISRKWIKLDAINNITEPVHDVAFAPNSERSFHILGVATKQNLKILRLTPVDKPSAQSSATKLDIHQTPLKTENDGFPIRKICWNVGGEVLASVGDDACVRMLNSYVGRAELCVLPHDEDEACHFAFYYSIRSGNIELVDTLCNRWPGIFFADHLDKLDETVSSAYEELKLKNILLTEEMEIFVENKLINLRFFSNTPGTDESNLNTIKERIKLVIDKIGLLKNEYSGAEIVDEKFLFVAKFITQNIYILKRQLKSTYDRLPWEEIEFCLISFVLSNSKRREINLFYRTALNKSKILNHLEYFAKKLEDEKHIMENANYSKLADLPKLSREKVVAEIISRNHQFEELYNDYQQIRDIHSLDKISDFIKLALLADPKEKIGQLIITRTLQVTGEYLKNTLESPKLSNITSDLLLMSLPKNTRKLIVDLRNSLSHAYSLSRRIKIEENTDVSFFVGIQNDIKKIDNVIYDIFYNKKMATIKTLLKRNANSESLDEIKEVNEILSNVDLEEDKMFRGNFKMAEHEKLERFIKELSDIITDQTDNEKEIFNRIRKIINSVEITPLENITDYFTGIKILKTVDNYLHNITIDDNTIREIKFRANETLKGMAPKIEPSGLKEIAKLSMDVFLRVHSRIQPDNVEKLKRLVLEIFFIVEFGTGDLKFIEELRGTLNEKGNKKYKQKKTDKVTADQLALKLSELKTILSTNLLSEQSVEMVKRKSDKKLLAAVEMLVLDILSILGSLNNCSRLENNLLYVDDNAPLLNGKCLRNHLAHDNALMDILFSDPSIAIMLNAKKLITEDLIKTKRNVGKLVRDDPTKLKEKYDKSLTTIINQKGMFAALEEGSLEDLKNYLQKGADIRATNIYSWTALHFAARGPSLEIIKYLLKQHVIPNVKDIDGQSPLHVAAAHGKNNVVDFFLKKTSLDINDLNNSGKTPLHMAAQNGNKATVKVLLENKADALIKDRGGITPLHDAIRNNHIDVAKILLAKDINININETMGGFTPLHEAAERGNLNLVNFLLQNGADANATNDRNWTSLHAAALNGHQEVVNALILKGADVNARVINGCTPLHYAAENGHEEIAIILLRRGAKVNGVNNYNITPLQYAVRYGQGEIAKILLDKNADSSIVTDGLTLMHFAVHFCSLEVVIVLLEYGVNVNAKDKKNNASPLHYVAHNGHAEIAKLLIERNADVNAITIDNQLTPLHIAAIKGHRDITELLINHDAKINALDINGNTPLHFAAISGRNDIIDLLIEKNAKVNIKSNNGSTPLHEAAQNGHGDATLSLIENSATVNARDNDCITPLHLAVVGGHKDVVRILIQNAASMTDEVLLHVAVEAGHKEILDILTENTNSDKVTQLLSGAIKGNHKEIVEMLIAKGADVNANGGLPLRQAVFAGYRDIVDILLKKKARVDIKYIEDVTPLHLAAARGHKEIVNALIKDAEIDAMTVDDATPLHLAAEEGHKEVVKILIEKGANVNAIYNQGSSLHVAAAHGHYNVVKFLLTKGIDVNIKDSKNRTALVLAVAHGHFQVMTELLQTENVNLDGKDDWTLLHIATQGNNGLSNIDVVKYLVNAGWDINAKNVSGSKPIHIAAREGFQDTVEFFLSKGLSIDERGASNQTLLHYAAIKGSLDVVNFLITEGADVNAKDVNDSMPIHTAVHFNNKKVIEILLKNGSVYNAVDKFYGNPLIVATDKNIINILLTTDKLFKAVRRNSYLEVENYIKEGAFINAKNSENVTPLHYASWKGYEEVANILLQNKANPNAVGKKRLTPLHYAATFSQLKIVRALLFNGAVYNAVSESGKTPSDCSENTTITNLFNLVSKSFTYIKNGNPKIIYDLNKIKDIDTVKAVMNACNEDNRTLVVAAVHSKFSKVEELKQISQGDLTARIEEAKVLLNESNYHKALIIFKSALEKRREILGPDNPGTLDVQSYIAKVLYKQGAYQEALDILEEVFQKQEKLLGVNNTDTLNTRSTIASVFYRQSKDEEALKICQEVYPKQKKILGANHEDTLSTQWLMALVLTNLGKCEEPLTIFRAAFAKSKKMVGIDHLATVSAHNNIAMVLANQGKHEEALNIYNDVFEKKKVKLGIKHADTLRTLHNIANVLFKQKEYHKALETQQEVLKIQKDVFGHNHPETLHTQYNLGNMLFAQGRWIGAMKAYIIWFDARKDILEPDHPSVLNVLAKFEELKMIFKFFGTGIPQILQHLQIEMNTACNSGDIETVQRLLKEGIDINDQDIDGRTPLHYAVSTGQINVVNVLLKNGANVTNVANKGNTPLHTATSNGNKEIIDILLQHLSGDKLHDFINTKTTSGGTTSLHVAAKNGSLEIVKHLLRNGAIYNIKNNDNKKPFDLSTDQSVSNLLNMVEEIFEGAKNGNIEFINKLRTVKQDVFLAATNARDSHGNTLLQVCYRTKT